jgi:thiol-disulfide isomerase/thioredoxin
MCFLLIPLISFSQVTSFEVKGKVSGPYHGKLFFFFDDEFKKKDSAEIKNGFFSIKATASLPILARFHLDQRSFIQDVYIDSKSTSISFTNSYFIDTNFRGKPDTLNQLKVQTVTGSSVEALKNAFQQSVSKLRTSTSSESQDNVNYYDKLLSFVKAHPNNKVSAYLVSRASDLTYPQVKDLYNHLSPTLTSTFEGRSVVSLIDRVDKERNKVVGNKLNDVVLADSSGQQVRISEFKTQVTVIEFWASWCGPCRKALPAYREFYQKYKNMGLEIVGVSIDSNRDAWKKALKEEKLEWPQIWDDKNLLQDQYAIKSIPQNLVIDKDGKIIGVDLEINEVEELIKKMSQAYIFID